MVIFVENILNLFYELLYSFYDVILINVGIMVR